MKKTKKAFKHSLVPVIEAHLVELGLDLDSFAKRSENEITYCFCNALGTSAVLKLYRHRDIGKPMKEWICFEFGVGLIDEANAAATLKEVCESMYMCFVPLRAEVMPFGPGTELLILILRAEVGVINSQHIIPIIESSLVIGDQLRGKFSLDSILDASATRAG